MQRDRCSAKAKSTGEQCQRLAIPGGKTCRFHGSAAKQVKAKAAERIAEEEARRQFARLDVPPVTNPLAEMAKIAGQVVAWKDMLAEKVNELTALSAFSLEKGDQLRTEVALFERGLDRCERFLTAMAKMNIDDRLVAIQEEQARVFLGAFQRVLEALDLSEEQQALVPAALERELTPIAAA